MLAAPKEAEDVLWYGQTELLMSVPQTDLAGVNDAPRGVFCVVAELPGLCAGYTLLIAVQIEIIASTPLTDPAHLVFSSRGQPVLLLNAPCLDGEGQ